VCFTRPANKTRTRARTAHGALEKRARRPRGEAPAAREASAPAAPARGRGAAAQSTRTRRSPKECPVMATARRTASRALAPRNSTNANPLGLSGSAVPATAGARGRLGVRSRRPPGPVSLCPARLLPVARCGVSPSPPPPSPRVPPSMCTRATGPHPRKNLVCRGTGHGLDSRTMEGRTTHKALGRRGHQRKHPPRAARCRQMWGPMAHPAMSRSPAE
jgi:hypothetical protein